MIKKDFPQLAWVVRREDANQGWYFERADGSYSEGSWTLFWSGIEDMEVVKRLVDKFVRGGKSEILGKSGSSTCSQSSPLITRKYSTSTRYDPTNIKRNFSSTSRTQTGLYQKIPQSPPPEQHKIGIIGGRGYTGNEVCVSGHFII